jgi:hypothetical protein
MALARMESELPRYLYEFTQQQVGTDLRLASTEMGLDEHCT